MEFSFLGVIIMIIFGLAAWTMIKRILPALLTLPIMALAMVIAAALWTRQISLDDIFVGVIHDGALWLHKAIITAFFGGILSFIMQKSGVAESMVKHGAELVGDNPFGVAVFCMGLIALLFTSIGGLGAVIMVAMVVLPMLSTVGIQPVVAGGIMLIGISMGGVMNAQGWVLMSSATGATLDEVKSFAVITFFMMAVTGALFVAVELYRSGLSRSLGRTLGIIGVIAVIGVIVVGIIVNQSLAQNTVLEAAAAENGAGAAVAADSGTPGWLIAVRSIVGAFFLWVFALAIWDILKRVERWRQQVVTIKWYAYLIPVFPLVLILVYRVEPLSAFFLGFLYAILVTIRPGAVSLTVQSMIQGSVAVLPAALLMVTIGMLLAAVMGPRGWSEANDGAVWPVTAAIQPLFDLIPTTRLGYIVVFSILAPLALYRGPLNIWGLGFGIAAILAGPDMFSAAAVMGMLIAVGQIQGVSDPTNTVNVWLANELRVDVQALMWKTLPYIWSMAVVGIVIASFLFLSGDPAEEPPPPEAPATVIDVEDVSTPEPIGVLEVEQ